MSPVVLAGTGSPRVAFITYSKGEYGLHIQELKQPVITAASADFGAPGPDHRLPGAAPAHAGRGQQDPEAGVREALPRGPAADQRRGHQRRRLLRRDGGDVRRRPGRSAVRLPGGIRPAVPHVVVLVRQLRPAPAVRGAGVLADPVLLRAGQWRAVRSGVRRDRRPRPGAVHADGPGRSLLRHLSLQSLPAPRVLRRRRELRAELRQSDTGAPWPTSIRSTRYGNPVFANGTFVPLTASFVQETTVFREFGPLSGSTMRLATRTHRRSPAPCRATRPTATRATTCGSAPTDCWRCACAGSRAGATLRTSSTSAGTPRCGATSTSSSWASGPSSATRSCGSR